MPIIKSAIKRVRQQKVRRARNVETKTEVRKQIKLFRADVSAADLKKAQADLVAAVSKLDRAVKRGVLHKNTAARKKSQLTKEYNAVAAKPYGTENPGTAKTKAKPAAKKPVAKAPAKKAAPKATAAKKPAAKKPASK
jgi:small subunit ribosomal protein S20